TSLTSCRRGKVRDSSTLLGMTNNLPERGTDSFSVTCFLIGQLFCKPSRHRAASDRRLARVTPSRSCFVAPKPWDRSDRIRESNALRQRQRDEKFRNRARSKSLVRARPPVAEKAGDGQSGPAVRR